MLFAYQRMHTRCFAGSQMLCRYPLFYASFDSRIAQEAAGYLLLIAAPIGYLPFFIGLPTQLTNDIGL